MAGDILIMQPDKINELITFYNVSPNYDRGAGLILDTESFSDMFGTPEQNNPTMVDGGMVIYALEEPFPDHEPYFVKITQMTRQEFNNLPEFMGF